MTPERVVLIANQRADRFAAYPCDQAIDGTVLSTT